MSAPKLETEPERELERDAAAQADATPLGARLAARIAAAGPMPLAEFMAACLADPEHGYYTTRPALGAEGDFTTAPEISQVFGELLGLWAAQAWIDQGAPAPICLAELGPGRGQLMADALRAVARAAPAFRSAAEVCLVEISPRLRAEQARRLASLAAPRFLEDAAALPQAPLFLIANEFFDALPISQWAYRGGAWRAQAVALEAGRFRRCDAAGGAPPDPRLAARFPAPPEGAMLETRAADAALLAEIGGRIARYGGAALIVDYAYDDAARIAAGGRDTLQALHGRRPADPFAAAGRADLTAHVNLDDLAAAAPAGTEVWGPVPQGRLLFALGVEARAATLMRARIDRAPAIAAGVRRLTNPTEMGQLFQALALTPAAAPPPPGFGGAQRRAGGTS